MQWNAVGKGQWTAHLHQPVLEPHRQAGVGAAVLDHDGTLVQHGLIGNKDPGIRDESAKNNSSLAAEQTPHDWYSIT